MTRSIPTTVSELETTTTEHPIIFFDGVCGLCNKFIDFVLPRDKAGLFRFAPLQGETAKEFLSAEDRESLKSVVLVDDGRQYKRSTAAVRILMKLGGFWKVVGFLGWLVPSPLRDLMYKAVASVRYRLFGKTETCRMPQPNERERFLD